MLYMEQSLAGRQTPAAPDTAAVPSSTAAFTPATPAAAGRTAAQQPSPASESAACGAENGTLPGVCAPMAFPYIPMQRQNPRRYGNEQALQRGTLFPSLDLPFHRELQTRFPAANTQLSELMALDFAIDELGLYLTTHRDDQDALALYWEYIRLGREGRKKYEEMHGPIFQTDITEGSFRWLDDPWPWDEGGNA